MASNSGFTTGLPSGSSTVNQTDDEFRSVKSYFDAWIRQEHYTTDGSAASAGIAKHGAGRAFVGTTSQLSNPTADNDGRLFFATNTGEMYVGQVSSSSWSVFADNINLGSAQTWTAQQEFTSGISASQATVTGAFTKVGTFTNILSTLTFINVGNLTPSATESFNVTLTGIGDGTPCVVGGDDSNVLDQGVIVHAVGTAADNVRVTFWNSSLTAVNLSQATFRILGFVGIS